MKKVLFIAYYFPPCSQIGGCIRSEKFVKYLKKYNWDSTVLSLSEKQFNPGKRSGIERFSSITPFRRPFNIEPYGWLPKLYNIGRKLLTLCDFNIIYVSCPPFPPANIAKSLKSYSSLPLVVDFRDAWTIGPYLNTNFLNKIINNLVFKTLEKSLLSTTDWLIVNSDSAYIQYKNKFPFLTKRISLIKNGFDEDDFVNIIRKDQHKQMTFVYCGSFRTADRNPIPLLEAFKTLTQKVNDISLRIIGDYHPEMQTIINKMNIEEYVSLVGKVPHPNAIAEMVAADVLVVTQEPDVSLITPIAGKTYEYLRAGRPILAILPDGDNAETIKHYAARYELVQPNDSIGVARSIELLYRDWSIGEFTEFQNPLDKYIERFNRDYLTSRLALIFNQLVNKKTII